MRRLCRIAFAALAAVSLLCCVAAAGLWVRSYSVVDAVGRVAGRDQWGAGASSGRLWVVRDVGGGGLHPAYADGWRYENDRSYLGPYNPAVFGFTGGWDSEFLGVAYARRRSSDVDWSLANILLAYPAALFAIPPLAWLAAGSRRRRTARRGRAGCCAKCGYDLRASPKRCPECGAVPAPRLDAAD